MKRRFKWVSYTVATAIFLGSTLVPLSVTLADTTSGSVAPQEVKSEVKTFDELYSELSPAKKQEFQDIVKLRNLDSQQQYQLLLDKYNENHKPTARWKVAVLKQAVKYAAKLAGAKLGEKTLADFVDYLTGFEGDIQTGLENGMVKYFHVNKTFAKWAAKTVVFVVF